MGSIFLVYLQTMSQVTEGEERRISLGAISNGIEASRARDIFKQFDEEGVRGVVRRSMERMYSTSRLLTFDSFPQDLHGGLDYIRRYSPDVLVLLAIIDSMNGNDMVRQFPDHFRKLTGQAYLDEDELIDQGLDMQIDKGTSGFARFAITAALTPTDARPALGPGHLRPEDTMQVALHLPDFTVLQTSQDRLEGIITLFSSHSEAVVATCSEYSIDIADLPALQETNRGLFAEIYKEAGSWTARNTLYGVLTDREGGGKQSLFTSVGRWNKAEVFAGHCPADVFVDTWLTVFGQELKANRSRLLTAMET